MEQTQLSKTTNQPAKHWVFTLNNYQQDDLSATEKLSEECEYLVYGVELGESGTPHLQGYFCLKTKKRRTAIAKILTRAYLQPKSPKSTVKQAVDYCKKEGNFKEFGRLPEEKHAAGNQANLDKWFTIKQLAQKGELESIEPEVFIKHYSTLKRIKADARPIPADLDWTVEPPNEWIYGPTGTGKSRTARAENPSCYLKMANKWWENYEDEAVVLIEDVGQSHIWMGDFLKIWADRYGFRAEIKHLSLVLRPKKIVITSNYHPSEIWSDPNVLEPILRRFKVRHLLTPAWGTTKSPLKRDVSQPNLPAKKRRAELEPKPVPKWRWDVETSTLLPATKQGVLPYACTAKDAITLSEDENDEMAWSDTGSTCCTESLEDIYE
ncbi:replication-associated protein [Crucivirus-195]|nr:replication-associated protein [Crucivirus-195]